MLGTALPLDSFDSFHHGHLPPVVGGRVFTLTKLVSCEHTRFCADKLTIYALRVRTPKRKSRKDTLNDEVYVTWSGDQVARSHPLGAQGPAPPACAVGREQDVGPAYSEKEINAGLQCYR